MLNNIKTAIFDFDGTLHDTIKIYGPAFRKAYEFLIDKAYAEKRIWTDEDISHWLGFNTLDMWKAFMPDLDPKIRNETSKIIGQEMSRQIKLSNGSLYEGVKEVLDYLKKRNITQVFLSNCNISYKEMVFKEYRLYDHFEYGFCSEEYNQMPKHEILAKIKHNFPEDIVIIGDRFHDIEAGKQNNIYTIGCKYGYSQEDELKNADVLIDNIRSLKDIIGL